jgi:hypothetical protein
MLNNKVLCEGWSFEEVEQRMVEAVLLWDRSPGQGRWPFASDGPWHLLTRQVRAGSAEDVWRHESDEVQRGDAPRSRISLTLAEVATRDQASEWLAILPQHDRRLVVLALTDKARGRRVSWLRMRTRLDVQVTGEALSWRYRQAIRRIAEHLTSTRVAKAD